MKNNKKRSNKGILLLLLLVLGISVGYAVLTTTLKINGTTTVKKASWNIHFGTIGTATTGSVTPTSAPALAATPDAGVDQQIDFSVQLNEPGDFYEFTVPVVNDGSLTGKISNSDVLTVNATDEDDQEVSASTYANYFTYEVVWDDTDVAPATNETLAGQASRTVRVRVEYKEDITANQLPQKDVTFNISLKMAWVQA